jgi:hypothetical protein
MNAATKRSVRRFIGLSIHRFVTSRVQEQRGEAGASS